MDYQRIYESIISSARGRVLTSYTERHHIVPKSMGGRDAETNIVRLTAREHYMAHWLLYKIHNTRSMSAAWHMMTVGGKGRRYTSHSFKYNREANAKTMSESMKGNKQSEATIEKRAAKLRGVPLSQSHKDSIRDGLKGSKQSPTTLEKLSKIRAGKRMSADTKRKISEANKGMKIIYSEVKCPHCDKIGRGGAMKRYHFDNCKDKTC